MPQVMVIEEEVLEELEGEGGLNEVTLHKRRQAYEHFVSFIKEETGTEVQECLVSEEGREEFSKAFGR